jgi:hypothetical protein
VQDIIKQYNTLLILLDKHYNNSSAFDEIINKTLKNRRQELVIPQLRYAHGSTKTFLDETYGSVNELEFVKRLCDPFLNKLFAFLEKNRQLECNVSLAEAVRIIDTAFQSVLRKALTDYEVFWGAGFNDIFEDYEYGDVKQLDDDTFDWFIEARERNRRQDDSIEYTFDFDTEKFFDCDNYKNTLELKTKLSVKRILDVKNRHTFANSCFLQTLALYQISYADYTMKDAQEQFETTRILEELGGN